MSEDLLILENLAYIASQQRTITIISNFRGVPIKLAAHVVHAAQKGSVRLCINQRQIITLKTTDKALIQSNLFSEMVIADIENVDLKTQMVTVSALRYVTDSMGLRKDVRVQPESPIQAEIISNHGFSLQGEVIDISVGGLSVKLDNDDITTGDMLIPQSNVEVRLGLPGYVKDQIHDLMIPAKIAYTRPEKAATRIGLMSFLDKMDVHIVRRYIFDRQTAILDEIKQMNQSWLSTT